MQPYAHILIALPASMYVYAKGGVLNYAFFLSGALLPDAIDGLISRTLNIDFFIIHRSISHWIWPYLIILFFYHNSIYLIAGVLLHLFLDSLTPAGIPFSPFLIRNKKVQFTMSLSNRSSFGLVKNRSKIEFCISIVSLLLFLTLIIYGSHDFTYFITSSLNKLKNYLL